jgi:hypothetical protein
VNIATGNTAGRDALRAYLRADTAISDAELLQAWDAAVDATTKWIRPGFTEDAPAGVQEFVLSVAAHIWGNRDSGGTTQILPDGTFDAGRSLTSNLVRRYAVLGGPYVMTPRVIA